MEVAGRAEAAAGALTAGRIISAPIIYRALVAAWAALSLLPVSCVLPLRTARAEDEGETKHAAGRSPAAGRRYFLL